MVASELQEAGGDIGRERRKYPRRMRDYEATLLSLTGGPLLRGRTLDLSKGGAKLAGSPCGKPLAKGDRVRLDVIIGRGGRQEDLCLLQVSSCINRVESTSDGLVVAVQFALELPEVP